MREGTRDEQPMTITPIGRSPVSASFSVSVICLLVSACTFSSSMARDEVLADSSHGRVFLQKVEDGWFRTAHPLSLSPAVLRAVFQGARVTPTSDKAVGEPVFSDEDVEFLSPLVRRALSQADKSQVVGFDVIHGGPAGNETTGGIIYVQGRLVHLTFTHYRAQPVSSAQGGLSRRLVSNPTGLDRRQLGFIPETAERSSRNEQPDVANVPSLASLVIDYDELSGGLPPQPLPVDEPVAVPEPIRENNTELESLREEVRILQRRLSELDRDVQRTQKP
jgi:hypothetical protein